MKNKRIVILVVVAVALLGGTAYITLRRTSAHKAPRTRADENVLFLESRVAANSDDSEAYRMLASGLVARAEATGSAADYDRALKELDKAETLDPGSLRLLQARAITLLSRHHFREAQMLAEQGLQKDPENADLLGIAGDGALEFGDLDTAEQHYRKLVENSPRLAGAWARLSHLEEVRGHLEEAAKLMEKSIDAGYPKPLSAYSYAWARAILGEIEAKRGHLDEARRQYNWALYKYADHPLALEFLADLDQWQGKNDEAESIYRKLLTIKADPKFKISLATLLERRGEKDEAARLRTEARRFYEQTVASGNEGYLRPLATLELSEGNYKRAAELAARDMTLRPTAESRTIYANILKAANDAGQSLDVAKNN